MSELIKNSLILLSLLNISDMSEIIKDSLISLLSLSTYFTLNSYTCKYIKVKAIINIYI